MRFLIELLVSEPLLLLFVVAALGYVLGRVSIGGFRLGVAAVLFVGLAIGALDPEMKLPEIVHLLGLVLFVYSIGLASGQHFFASLKRKGLRDNLFVLGMLVLAALVAAGCDRFFELPAGRTAGVYCGSTTNTPALAAVMQTMRQNVPPEEQPAVVAEPVIGYSMAYPIGVLAMIAAIAVMRRFWKIDDAAEVAATGASRGKLTNRTIRVSNPLVVGLTPVELTEHSGIDVVFGRMKRGEQAMLATDQTRLELGDLLSVVGRTDQIKRMTEFLGQTSDERIALERKEFDYRQIIVSNPEVAGHILADLDLPQQFGAVVTRLRRGDIEFVPHGRTMLELGDRLRVVTRPDHLDAITRFLGDSIREISEIDILSLGLGIAIGLLIGMIPLPFPGGVTLKLGIAGGPLLVSLLLGTIGRTGPIIWTLPFNASLTLRQFGLVLFLAGVGTRSGYAFVSTLMGGGAWPLLISALLITGITGFTTLLVGYKILRIPMGQIMGLLAGMQTQPALLAYSQEQTRNELPSIGYATVYPLAMVVKILVAQLLLLV